MLHFKLHTFIFICFPNLQRSIPNSSALAFFFLPTAKLQSVLNFFFSFDYFWRTISTCCMKIFIAPETASAAIKNDISIERARNDLVTFFTYPPFWVRASGENWFSVFFSPFFVCTQIFQKTINKFFFVVATWQALTLRLCSHLHANLYTFERHLLLVSYKAT